MAIVCKSQCNSALPPQRGGRGEDHFSRGHDVDDEEEKKKELKRSVEHALDMVDKASEETFPHWRDMLTAALFSEMNAVIFEGKLPATLPITWNAQLKTTGGCAIFAQVADDSAAAHQDGAIVHSAEKDGVAQKWVLAHKFLVRVELSTKVADDAEKLKQILCHELCHVAAWVVNEEINPPHGPAFKYWAGLSAQRYPGIKVTTFHFYMTRSQQGQCATVLTIALCILLSAGGELLNWSAVKEHGPERARE
jgi:hypothetical protein